MVIETQTAFTELAERCGRESTLLRGLKVRLVFVRSFPLERERALSSFCASFSFCLIAMWCMCVCALVSVSFMCIIPNWCFLMVAYLFSFAERITASFFLLNFFLLFLNFIIASQQRHSNHRFGKLLVPSSNLLRALRCYFGRNNANNSCFLSFTKSFHSIGVSVV